MSNLDSVKRVARRIVPRSVLDHLRPRRSSSQIELPYLETHLTDHCNLNCRGCDHLSPLSPKRFTDFDIFRRDMSRLGELFTNIRVLRLMGGEPLLHPRVSDFLMTARALFPKSDIRLVTNGILLPSMPQSFWEGCSRDRAVIDLSLYPVRIDLDKIRGLAGRWAVQLSVYEVRRFYKFHINLSGDSDSESTFRACRQRYYCPFLEAGRVYVCNHPTCAHLLCERFGVTLTTSERDSISIYDTINPAEILEHLDSPIPFCRYCTTRVTLFKWARSKRAREEWLD